MSAAGGWPSLPPTSSRAAAQASRPAWVSPRLRALAARAENRSSWKALRHYAQTTRNPQERSLAYFVLGYREYRAGESAAALADLDRAVRTNSPIAEFAAYYRGVAALEAHDPGRAARSLESFGRQYPQSPLRLQALRAFARASLEAGEPEPVIAALTAEPATERTPSLEALLGEAYQKAGRMQEAARAFEIVYYEFPNSFDSQVAEAALEGLKTQLGASFPSASESMRTERAKILRETGHREAALREYETLLKSNVSSALAYRWTLERAECLVALKRYRDAEESLVGRPWPDAELDAERQELLVDTYARLDDQASMLRALDALANSHPQSHYYAAALERVGHFFAYQQDWGMAQRYYQALLEAFPDDPLAREAGWGVAWAAYLRGDYAKVGPLLRAYVDRYPDSPHTAAALYWLGRIAEQSGSAPSAAGFYSLVAKRFSGDYYAQPATDRLKWLRSAGGRSGTAVATAFVGTSGRRVQRLETDSFLEQLTQRIPTLPAPSEAICATSSSARTLSPFGVLKAMNLNDLAVEYARRLLDQKPGDPRVLATLARLEAEQKHYAAALFATRELVPLYPHYQTWQLPREVWVLLYPRVYWPLVRRYARANRVDPYLVMALIRQESAFDARATSSADARGLMQVRPPTAEAELRNQNRRERGRRRRRLSLRPVPRALYNPAYNLRLGCRFLRALLDEFSGNMAEALAAYNAGDARVKAWLARESFPEPAAFVESIPMAETRVYVESVLRDAVRYRRLISGKATFKKCR